MATRFPSKHARDQALDFQGFLTDLQDWELSLKEKDKKMKAQAEEKDVPTARGNVKHSSKLSSSPGVGLRLGQSRSDTRQHEYSRNHDAISRISSSFMTEESLPDAASEKELGNEYFKQRKFKEAIDCYSRSIALLPTAVAYANRAMAYIKIKRQV
ncbi:RNA polymerase II-associated protein 3 [Vitis vinifera]|uniref:RNA polymerase II-associated protein 3 n=1 Tax=Vitis vinifera TaxID=29760 RepID=A0A438DUJ7_VITVI|nr:RNA polymerase II-associated protein 3 [Vitis vinifera]